MNLTDSLRTASLGPTDLNMRQYCKQRKNQIKISMLKIIREAIKMPSEFSSATRPFVYRQI